MDTGSLLVALQLGDSFFPSGAGAFSFGLEGLRADGQLPSAQAVERFLVGQLEGRWASCDRVALVHAHAAAGDHQDVARIDQLCDTSIWVESWRLGGRRLGRALLRTHLQMGTPGAAEYEQRVRAGQAAGQVSVVHGLMAAGCGLTSEQAAALSAYGVAVCFVGAALRLGVLGHIEGQQILARQRGCISRLVAAVLPPLEQMGAWVPGAEIASMRQESRPGRLFAT